MIEKEKLLAEMNKVTIEEEGGSSAILIVIIVLVVLILIAAVAIGVFFYLKKTRWSNKVTVLSTVENKKGSSAPSTADHSSVPHIDTEDMMTKRSTDKTRVPASSTRQATEEVENV